MDTLKVEDQARALIEKHGAGVEAYVEQHLEAARSVGLQGAVRDWEAVKEAVRHQKAG